MNNSRAPTSTVWQRAGLVLAPVVAILMMFLPPAEGLSHIAWYTLSMAVWMAIWWMTEAIPLAITALLPVATFPLFGISSFSATAESYADPLIFLFFGGFILAQAIHKHHLDRRLAASVLRIAGTRPANIVAALMAVSAFLSMWVSNTATAMVMLPIGLSIVSAITHLHPDNKTIAPALLLGIAYAATIGGIGTIIGTPPNALFASFLENQFNIQISFVDWMVIGLPLVLLLLPIAWIVLTRIVFVLPAILEGATIRKIRDQVAVESSMRAAEKTVLVILVAVVLCWLGRPVLSHLYPHLPLSDAGIAITGAIALFILPVELKSSRFLLAWEDVAAIRWDVLILFGGGLALASAMSDTGLAGWTGSWIKQLSGIPVFLFLLCLGILVVLIGELASNTALAAILLPVAAALAIDTGVAPALLMLPICLFATLGFMLPVATPPNAIVFGSHAVEMRHMLQAGALLDILGIFIVAVYLVVFGESLLLVIS